MLRAAITLTSSASGCAVSVPGQRKSWGEMAAPLALRPIPLPA
jgi:hypothetical protein